MLPIKSAGHLNCMTESPVADPGFAKAGGGLTMARAQSTSLNRVWGQSPQQGRGAESLVGGQGGLKLKAFYQLSYKKWPKVKD